MKLATMMFDLARFAHIFSSKPSCNRFHDILNITEQSTGATMKMHAKGAKKAGNLSNDMLATKEDYLIKAFHQICRNKKH